MIMNEVSNKKAETTILEWAKAMNSARKKEGRNRKPDFVIMNGENMIIIDMDQPDDSYPAGMQSKGGAI